MLKTSSIQSLYSVYDNLKWEVVKYESGTVTVTTKNKDLSHFLVHGPSISPEADRDNLRYRYALEFAEFLSSGKRPEWMTTKNIRIEYDQVTMSWNSGASITACDSLATEHEHPDLFHWLVEQLAYSYQADRLAEDIDSDILAKMLGQAKQTGQLKPGQHLNLEGLVAMRKKIDDTTHLGNITNIFTADDWEGTKFINELAAGMVKHADQVAEDISLTTEDGDSGTTGINKSIGKLWMNEEPFSYMGPHCTWFRGTRCDLRDGVVVDKPIEKVHHEDWVAFGAWHRGQIHPECNGFPGYDCVKFRYEADQHG